MAALRAWLAQWQLVWWGWRSCLSPPLIAWSRLDTARDGSIALIYSWTAVIGPLEIRRWNPELKEGR
jgi:hypothetical protein